MLGALGWEPELPTRAGVSGPPRLAAMIGVLANAIDVASMTLEETIPTPGTWTWWRDLSGILGGLVGGLLGGLATAVVAYFAFSVSRRERTDRLQADEDRKQAERDRDEARSAQRHAELQEWGRQREAQARRVVVTMTRIGSGHRDPARVKVACHNYSDLPVTNVTVRVNGHKVVYASTLLPGGTQLMETHTAPPGEKVSKGVVEAVFRDLIGGVWWRRTAEGTLEDLGDEDPAAPST